MAFLFKDYTGGNATTAPSDYYRHSGGTLRIWIKSDDFDNGSISFEASADNGLNWIQLDEVTGDPAIYTSDKITELLKIGTGDLLRAVLSESSGATTNLNVKIDF